MAPTGSEIINTGKVSTTEENRGQREVSTVSPVTGLWPGYISITDCLLSQQYRLSTLQGCATSNLHLTL